MSSYEIKKKIKSHGEKYGINFILYLLRQCNSNEIIQLEDYEITVLQNQRKLSIDLEKLEEVDRLKIQKLIQQFDNNREI